MMTETENCENLNDGVAECEEALALCKEAVKLIEQASNKSPFGSRVFYMLKQDLLDVKKLALGLAHIIVLRKTGALPSFTPEKHGQIMTMLENIRTDVENFRKSVQSA